MTVPRTASDRAHRMVRAVGTLLVATTLVIGSAGVSAADDGNGALGAVQTQSDQADNPAGEATPELPAGPDDSDVAAKAAKKAAKAAKKAAKLAAKKAALKIATVHARAVVKNTRAAARKARSQGKTATAAGARVSIRSGEAAARAAEVAKVRANKVVELIRAGASVKKLDKAATRSIEAARSARAAAKTAKKLAAKVEARLAKCSPQARACIDLTTDMAWLQSGGKIVFGPVPITAGRQGHLTRPGLWHVYYKNQDHKSREFNGAPMPYSVFFDSVGIAFHVGSLSVASHGCIHLSWSAGVTFFDFLRYGDQVHVFGKTPYASGQIYV